jgi:DNA-binding response OmpR family regulator
MAGRSVLVVEEDRVVRELVVELLRDAGFTVLQSRAGDPVPHLAREFEPAVIVVNSMLSDTSGLALLERLRREPATHRIPVVLMGGPVGGRGHHDTGAHARPDSVVPFPFDIDVLLEHVEQLALGGRERAG